MINVRLYIQDVQRTRHHALIITVDLGIYDHGPVRKRAVAELFPGDLWAGVALNDAGERRVLALVGRRPVVGLVLNRRRN